MASDTSNRTSSTSNELYLLPASQCIPWIVVLAAECLSVVVFNIITIVVFVKQRQLQRQSLYLIIHLAIVDLLVGAISGPLQIERMGEYCDLWEYHLTISWGFHAKFALLHLFSFASLANLVAISLERVYVTFRPYSTLLIGRRVCYVIIPVIWLVALIRESVQIALDETQTDHGILTSATLYFSYYLFCLFFICFSYGSIFLKTRCIFMKNTPSEARIIRQRKLTATLLLVTFTSLLSLLPANIYVGVLTFRYEAIANLPLSSNFHMRMTVLMLFLANSLANPIMYSMRMQAFREGLAHLFRAAPSHANTTNEFELRQTRENLL